MNKNCKLKKGIFVALFCIDAICLFYSFLSVSAGMSEIIAALVYLLHLDKYIFTEARMISYICLIPIVALIAILWWIFYRKETKISARIAATVLPLIAVLPLPLNFTDVSGWIYGIFECTVYIAIGVLLIRGVIKYPKLDKQKVTAG